MVNWMPESPEIPVYLVHPAVLATLAQVESLHQGETTLAPFAFPDFSERRLIDVSKPESIFPDKCAATINATLCHNIRPEKRGGTAA